MMLSRAEILAVFLISLGARFLQSYLLVPSLDWSVLENGSELGQIAQNLAAGRGFSSPFEPGVTATAWYGPITPLIWALVFRYFGSFTAQALLVLYLLQALARAVAAIFFALTVARILEPKKGGLLVGCRPPLILFLLIAIWPESVLVTVIPWYTVWQELGTALLLFLLVTWLENPRPRKSAAVGLAAGFATLVNPLPALTLAWGMIVGLARRPSAERMHQVGLVSLAFFLIILPWLLRNYYALGILVPVRSNFGVELRQGNNPSAGLVQTPDSRHPALNSEELERYRRDGEARYVSEASHEAAEYIAQNPLLSLRRWGSRVLAFWTIDAADLSLQRDGGVFAAAYRVVQTVVPLILCLVGFLLAGRRAFASCGLLLGVALLFPIPYYLTQVAPAYTHLPRLMLFLVGLVAVTRGLSWRKERR